MKKFSTLISPYLTTYLPTLHSLRSIFTRISGVVILSFILLDYFVAEFTYTASSYWLFYVHLNVYLKYFPALLIGCVILVIIHVLLSLHLNFQLFLQDIETIKLALRHLPFASSLYTAVLTDPSFFFFVPWTLDGTFKFTLSLFSFKDTHWVVFFSIWFFSYQAFIIHSWSLIAKVVEDYIFDRALTFHLILLLDVFFFRVLLLGHWPNHWSLVNFIDFIVF